MKLFEVKTFSNISKYGMGIAILLLAITLGSCGKSKKAVEINGQDVTSLVAEDISKLLERAPWKDIIIGCEQVTIETSEEIFKETVQKKVGKDAILYPQLTYKIKYNKGFVKKTEAQCDAIAYAIVKEGKLKDNGLILSENIMLFTNIITYSNTVTNSDYIIFSILLLMVCLWTSRRLRPSNKKAYIIRFGCLETGLGGYSFSRNSDNASIYTGNKLEIAVGRGTPLNPLASSVDIKFAYINSNGNGELAGGHVKLMEKSMIGVGEIFFPSKPYTKKFICKAWIVKAYYDDGKIWENIHADKEEQKAKNFIKKKLILST